MKLCGSACACVFVFSGIPVLEYTFVFKQKNVEAKKLCLNGMRDAYRFRWRWQQRNDAITVAENRKQHTTGFQFQSSSLGTFLLIYFRNDLWEIGISSCSLRIRRMCVSVHRTMMPVGWGHLAGVAADRLMDKSNGCTWARHGELGTRPHGRPSVSSSGFNF